MTRHEVFKRTLPEALKLTKGNEMTLTDFMLVSIAGSLCMIADALNPEAAKVEEEP